MRAIAKSLFITLFMFALTAGHTYAQGFDNIAADIRKGDAAGLSKSFGGNVEISIKDAQNSYSKSQAEAVLKNFFGTHVPKSFNIKNPMILQVGTTANKNIERLIEAIDGINCQLNIVGFLAEALIVKLQKHSINYLNFTDLTEEEIVEQYINCDIVSFVSTYEGFGMPIVEANATGRVVITSNLFSMPEVASNAAHIVDPYNIVDIKEGFLRIINDADYREGLIKKGLKNCKRFDGDEIANKYLQLYQKICYKN